MTDLRWLADRWRRYDVAVRDLPFGLLLVAMSVVPALHDYGTQVGGLPNRPFGPLTVAVAALQGLPLAVRRRWPPVCLVLVGVGFAADQLLGFHTVAGTALPVALLSAGAHQARHRRVTAVLVSAAYLPLAVALHRLGGTEPVEEYVTFYLGMVLAWGIGAWLRATRTAEAERHLRVAAETRAAERTRIARELHDVVTHHVTAMVVQAEAARYLTATPDRLDETLDVVTDTGRRAIADLRHLLDLLNPDHGTAGTAGTGGTGGTGGTEPPVPSPGELRALVERTRLAGQPVEFTEEGSPRAETGSAEVAAYRVVQEALTNALKHARGSRTTVHVRHGAGEITVAVGTDGPAAPAGSPAGSPTRSPGGSGRGLTGLSERIGVLGGDFSASRQPGGGFLVRARIPAGGAG